MRETARQALIWRASALAVACLVLVSLLAVPAWAYNESGTVDPARIACTACHPTNLRTGASLPSAYTLGPHSDYSTVSGNCGICHAVHKAVPTGIILMPKQTIKANCEVCHDGTGGQGVYGAIAARGLTVGAQHRIDTTDAVPGGDAATGGTAYVTFTGAGGNLSCDDCHNPHNGGTVAGFQGDRQRVQVTNIKPYLSSKLLKRRPTSASTDTTAYGSDWCGACHKGRLSGSGMPNNHPVESKLTNAAPFYYGNVALLSTDAPTGSTVMGGMGGIQRLYTGFLPNNGGNRGYLMPLQANGLRTPLQQGHYPICEQCHEDSRNVGTLSADGLTADAAASVVTSADGRVASDNPRFQNFPHETQNARFLVETGDDLCTNCHPTGILP